MMDVINFENHEIDLSTVSSFYIFSDGFYDQFGGKEGKKFMSKRLKRLLVEQSKAPMDKQKEEILDAWNDWKKDVEQIDDVCLIGLKI